MRCAVGLDRGNEADTGLEAGVRRILLVGGDTERAAGPYWNALAVMESGLLLEHGIQRIDVAAYPEGHPRVPSSAVREALLKKLQRGRALGFDVRVITQFCFEGTAIVRWLQGARKDGLAAAVRIGVAGPARVRALLSYAARCGGGNSVRALWDGPVSLRGLLSTHGPEDVLASVGGALVADARLDPLELHVFSFGGFRVAAQWLRAVANGRFGELGERNARANAATA